MTSVHKNIKSLSEEDRPREKLLEKGASVLSNSELLAILLGSGNRKQTAVELAQDMLFAYENSIDKISRQDINSLTKFKGVGQAKAISIVAAFELCRRRQKEENNITKIASSKDAFKLLSPLLSDLNVESFYVIYLNRGNRIISVKQISKGGISGTVVDIKLIIKAAILQDAQAIILAHNHPSGNLTPSSQDKNITKKISDAAKYFEITILDHIIVAKDDYLSFADEMLL
jgi:DNA repair protein RadC